MKRSIRKTARKQMKDLRSEKRMSKKLQKAYDKAGGFIDKEQKRQAKAQIQWLGAADSRPVQGRNGIEL